MTNKNATIEDHNSLLIEEQVIKLENLALLMAQQMEEAAIVSLLVTVIDDIAEVRGDDAVRRLVTDLREVTTEMLTDYSASKVRWGNGSKH